MRERRETSAGFRRVSYHACAGVSLTTSDVFLTCDTTHRTGLRAKLQLKAGVYVVENSSQCETMPRTPQSRKFGESASPRTPIKPVGSGKDSRCLLCGLDFKISGQNTWRSLKNKELRERVCRLLEKTLDFDRESTRLCKKCFRRIEAIYKRSKDIEDSKREIVEHYEKTKESNKACFGVNGDRFKRLTKQSPGTSEKRGKRRCFDTPVNEEWRDDFGCVPLQYDAEDRDRQFPNYGEEWQDDCGFAPLQFDEEDFQGQFPEHGGASEVTQHVNIPISHGISVVESVPVESNREAENVKVKVSFLNF